MIDSAQDSAHFFKIDPAIVAKWQASGLLEGLEKTKAEKNGNVIRQRSQMAY